MKKPKLILDPNYRYAFYKQFNAQLRFSIGDYERAYNLKKEYHGFNNIPNAEKITGRLIFLNNQQDEYSVFDDEDVEISINQLHFDYFYPTEP